MKIGYQGVNGAFSQMALRKFFADCRHEEIGYSSFTDMFADVQNGVLDYALFPVENTTTGIIARTYDYFQYYDVHAVGEVIIPIRQNLIALNDAKLEDIREVYSHPEALSQCQEFFGRHSEMKPVVYEDTALAAKYIREEGDLRKAAIASDLAADLYGLKILIPDIQDNERNMTRFLVVSSREDYPFDADKVSIRIVLKHVPGALYHALGIFASKNINVVKLESRPIVGELFEYCFYIDFSGNQNNDDVKETLRRLAYDCLDLKVFGFYKADRDHL